MELQPFLVVACAVASLAQDIPPRNRQFNPIAFASDFGYIHLNGN